ncbi:MAG: GNAT family N-acetyltransferase [Candidatus Bathycorpusculaceae bacterium]
MTLERASMVTVRVATLKDLRSILELEKKDGQPAKEDLHALFKLDNPNEKCYFFVAEHDGKILGYSRMHIYRWNSSAYIISLLVDAEHRRKGIGTLLLKAMENFAREKRARILMFDTSTDNAPALQLYFKNGFRICGYNDKIYEDGKIAIYLAKEL